MVKTLIEEKLFDPKISMEIWITYCSQFKPDRSVVELYKAIEKHVKASDL